MSDPNGYITQVNQSADTLTLLRDSQAREAALRLELARCEAERARLLKQIQEGKASQ